MFHAVPRRPSGFPATRRSQDAEHMILHADRDLTPGAHAAARSPCATKHKTKPGRKCSAAVLTCVYFAADHVSTLRFHREH